MQPIQAIVAAWPFAPGKLDPAVFFRESPLRFQGLMDCGELLQLLQRGAFTVIEYGVPQASGSCTPRLWIRYSASIRGEQFAVTVTTGGREETVQCFGPTNRADLEAWLGHFIAADVAAVPQPMDTPRSNSMPQHGGSPATRTSNQFVVAYVRAGERRRAGHTVRAAFGYRKAHPATTAGSTTSGEPTIGIRASTLAREHAWPSSPQAHLAGIDGLLDRLEAGQLHAIAYGDRRLAGPAAVWLRIHFTRKARGMQFVVQTREMGFEGRSLCFNPDQRDALKARLGELIAEFGKLGRALARLRSPADSRLSEPFRPDDHLYAIVSPEADRDHPR